MFALRPYQKTASDAVMIEWRSVFSTLLKLFTGGGKTVIFADLIRRIQPMPAIVLVHREELAWQAKERIESTTGLKVGIEMGELHAEPSSPVIVATVQTLYARRGDQCRMGKFDPLQFGCLIADEFHHYMAPRFRDVILFFRKNPDLRVLGCTATPKRHDGLALSPICESIAFDYGVKSGVDDGWLVDIKAKEAFIKSLDLENIHTAHGDFVEGELARVMEEEEVLHGVASVTMQEIGERRAIVYTVRVKQAERLCEIFNRHKDGSAFWICGETNKDDRREMLRRFKNGEIQILCNVGIATEGFDDPGIRAVVMARPTMSAALCEQMIGRGDRPLPGVVDGPGKETVEQRKSAIAASAKPDCLVIDLAGNLGKHKLATAIDVLGGDLPSATRARAISIAKASAMPVSVTEALSREKEKAELKRKLDAERRAKIKPTATYNYQWVNVFAEEYKNYSGAQHAGKARLTERQYAYLKKNGIDPEKLTYWSAIKEIERIANQPATEKQKWMITKCGGIVPVGITKTAASKLIEKLKNAVNTNRMERQNEKEVSA
jgi:superfamily II DNA or RNA helicase